MAGRSSAWLPPAKRSRSSAVDTARTETGVACVACGQRDAPTAFLRCHQCTNHFHPACVNLPAVPEAGACFCRWSCFAAFHKPSAPRAPLGDFPRLAAQLHATLHPNTGTPPVRLEATAGSSSRNGADALAANGHGPMRRPPRPASATLGTHSDAQPQPSQPSPPPSLSDAYRSDDVYTRRDDPPAGRFVRKAQPGRSASPSLRRRDTSHSYSSRPPSALASEDAGPSVRGPRSFSRASSETEYVDASFPRSHAGPATGGFARDNGSHTHDPSRSGTVAYRGVEASAGAALQAPVSHAPLAPGRRDQPLPSLAPQPQPPSSRLPVLHSVGSRRDGDDGPLRPSRASPYAGSSSHGSLDGSTSSMHARQYSDKPQQSRRASSLSRDGPLLGSRYTGDSQARTPSPFGDRGPLSATVLAPSNGTAGFASSGPVAPPPSQQPPQAQQPVAGPTKEVDVPWLNSTAFPSTIYGRFTCHADDLNRVFRVDLSRAFAEKTTHLFQAEIDFFFRYD